MLWFMWRLKTSANSLATHAAIQCAATDPHINMVGAARVMQRRWAFALTLQFTILMTCPWPPSETGVTPGTWLLSCEWCKVPCSLDPVRRAVVLMRNWVG
jgi:hypothetical protein